MKNETKERLVLAGGLLAFVTTIFVGGVVAGRYSKKPAEVEEETPPSFTPTVEANLAEKTSQKPAPRKWRKRGIIGFLAVTALTVIIAAASQEEEVKKPYY